MPILLFAEHDNQALADQTARTLTAARAIGGDIDILVAGQGARAVAEEAARLQGVRQVLLAESDALAERLAEPSAALILSLAGDYDTIIAPAGSAGKSVLPRVAALLDVMQVSEAIEVVAPDTFKRPIYAGNAVQTVQTTDAKKVVTVRTAAFAPAESGADVAPIVETAAGEGSDQSRFVENRFAASDRPELASAKIVGRWDRRRSSARPSCRSLTRWGPPSARRGRRSMRAMPRTTGRWARPARSSRPTSMSPAAFRARSSIWRG